jgi:hypothetical protein
MSDDDTPPQPPRPPGLNGGFEYLERLIFWTYDKVEARTNRIESRISRLELVILAGVVGFVIKGLLGN